MRRRSPTSTLFPYTTLFRSHEKGAPHLVNPEKLLASAARLYGGEMDRLWGEVRPVPAESLVTLTGGERVRSEEHTSELQSLRHLVCRLLLEKKKKTTKTRLI